MCRITGFLRSRIIIACCIAVGAPAQVLPAPSNADWKEYLVPDFGTRVEYPAGIFSVSEGKSEVGVGERLSTADKRASLTIYSRPNQAGETPASYLRQNFAHVAIRHPLSASDAILLRHLCIQARNDLLQPLQLQSAARAEHSLFRSGLP
jgi:hypothetical protein